MTYNYLGAIGECTLASGVTISNQTALMTVDNIIHFCGDISNSTISSGAQVLTLPSSFPRSSTRKVCLCTIEHPSATPRYTTGYFVLSTNNILYTAQAIASTDIVHLNELQFNLNEQFYSATIGNTTGFTSPLDAR